MNKQSNNNEKLRSRLLEAVDLMEFGIAMMRQNIARKFPNALPEEIDKELQRWLIEQPVNFVPNIPPKCD